MRVLVFEHVCGGGMSREKIDLHLKSMGVAMLRAVVADLVAIGAQVTTLRDQRVEFAMEGVAVHAVRVGKHAGDLFDAALCDVDAVLVIAPETGGILEDWARRVEAMAAQRPRWLGCSAAAIRQCADKLSLARQLATAGVPTPPTFDGIALRVVALPAVVKPRDGAGCEHTFIVRSQSDADALPPRDDFITQPFVAGLSCSAAFVIHGERVRPLRAGSQSIHGETRLAYSGGCLPLPPALEDRALKLGERAVRAMPELAGFIGVDLVLGEQAEDDRVIEINPRLTVAYAGLRALCIDNLAAAIVAPPGAATSLRWREGVVRYNAAGDVKWSES